MKEDDVIISFLTMFLLFEIFETGSIADGDLK